MFLNSKINLEKNLKKVKFPNFELGISFLIRFPLIYSNKPFTWYSSQLSEFSSNCVFTALIYKEHLGDFLKNE